MIYLTREFLSAGQTFVVWKLDLNLVRSVLAAVGILTYLLLVDNLLMRQNLQASCLKDIVIYQ